MTAYSNVTPSASIKLNRANDEAPRVHGALHIAGWVYGSTRARDSGVTTAAQKRGGIVRYRADDLSTYQILRFASGYVNWPYATRMDAMTYTAGAIWTVGSITNDSGGSTPHLFRVDPATFTETGRWAINGAGTEAIVGDGSVIYMIGGTSVTRRSVSNPGVHMAGAALVNVSSQPALSAINGLQPAGLHSAVYDSGYLYINNSNGIQSQAWGYLLKVRASDLQAVGYVQIPVCTDDMADDAQWVYLGVEESNPSRNPEAYGWGALAVRKSDLARRVLPRLGASDPAGAVSYASLTFGSYLVDVKNNSHVYVIDKSNPDLWNINISSADLSAVLLHDATILLPAGVYTTPNELVTDDLGHIHAFVWNTTEGTADSSAIRFQIAGINLAVTPTISTLPATDVNRSADSATLHGDLTSAGGAAVTARGFMVGTANPPTVKYPAAGTGLGPFSLQVAGLANGVVYYRAYATNAQGDGVGDVRSFDVGPEPGVFEGFVRLDGQPVQGAKVYAINVSTGSVAGSATSDAAGRYRITGLASGSQFHLTCEYGGAGEYGANSKPRRQAP